MAWRTRARRARLGADRPRGALARASRRHQPLPAAAARAGRARPERRGASPGDRLPQERHAATRHGTATERHRGGGRGGPRGAKDRTRSATPSASAPGRRDERAPRRCRWWAPAPTGRRWSTPCRARNPQTCDELLRALGRRLPMPPDAARRRDVVDARCDRCSSGRGRRRAPSPASSFRGRFGSVTRRADGDAARRLDSRSPAACHVPASPAALEAGDGRAGRQRGAASRSPTSTRASAAGRIREEPHCRLARARLGYGRPERTTHRVAERPRR